ncbi:MAG: hypothetical protein HW416_1114 [Chloroflexi bacterium]|nr:hypothetical protein [Chloroflexota bacterium]
MSHEWSVRHKHSVFRRLVGPAVLIAFGILLLLTNLGLIPVDVWRMTWRLWPLLLVALGLELLITGRASWGMFVVALLVVLAVGVLAENALVPPGPQGHANGVVTLVDARSPMLPTFAEAGAPRGVPSSATAGTAV